MLLVLDIGNTHVTVGTFRDGKLLGHWRLSSGSVRTEDEIWIMLRMLCESMQTEISSFQGCAISSVVPDLTPVYSMLAEERLGVPTVVVSAELDLELRILYRDPQSVGADRICNAVAGYAKYGGPLIIVDFGTATTFDVVSENQEYLGGVIAPGVESSSYVLHRYAARLPKVELKFPDRVIGTSTEMSMQAGIMYGSVDLVRGLVQRIFDELGRPGTIITTGGIAGRIFDRLELSAHLEPFLTLEGLRLIFEEVHR